MEPSRLTFNEGNHSYWLADPRNGRKMRAPSVSSLKNTLYPFTGERWYIQQAGQALEDGWDALAETAPPLRGESLAALTQARLNYGRDFGTAVHHYCEHLWTGDVVDVPEEYASHVQAVAEWWGEESPSLMVAEAMCYADPDSIMGPMAGRLDLMVDHPKRGPGLLDLKTWTSRAAGVPRINEWAFQLAAYSTMDFLVTPTGDEPFPALNWYAVLHVGPGGLRAYYLDRANWEKAAEQVDTARILKRLRPGKMEEL